MVPPALGIGVEPAERRAEELAVLFGQLEEATRRFSLVDAAV